jgi:rRNA maturation RNase YbeY
MIQFFIDDADISGVPEEILIPVMKKICNDHDRHIEYINVILMNDEKLLEINRDFLQHDYYTDIITFNYSDEPKQNIEGELYISVDRVQENASNLGLNFEDELSRVVIHGILHLCGYQDKDKSEQKTMQVAENKYINKIVPRGTLKK